MPDAARPPRRRRSIVGPLVAWELVKLARAGGQLRWRLGLSIALLAMTYLLYINDFPQADVLSLSFESIDGTDKQKVARFTESFVRSFMFIELLVVFVLTPILVIGSVTDEVQRRTMTYLLTTDLTNWEILGGKTLGRLTHLAGILATGLPVVGLMQFFGGIDGRAILGASLVLLGTSLSLGGFALWMAVQHRSFWPAALRTYGVGFAATLGLATCGCFHPIAAVLSPPMALLAVFGAGYSQAINPVGVGVTFAIVHGGFGVGLIVASVKTFRKPAPLRRGGRLPKWVGEDDLSSLGKPAAMRFDGPRFGEADAAEKLSAARPALAKRAPIVIQVAPPSEPADDELLDPLVYDEAGLVAVALPKPREDLEPLNLATSRPLNVLAEPPRPIVPPRKPEGQGSPPQRKTYRQCPADADPLLWKELTFSARRDTQANMQDLSRVAWAVMGIIAALFLMTALCALGGTNTHGDLADSGAGAMMRLAAGLGWLGTLMAASLKGVHLFAVERQRQTLETLVSLPVSREEIVRAKFKAALWNLWWPAGLASVMLCAWVLMAGNVLQIVVAVAGIACSAILAAAVGLRVGLTAVSSMRGLIGSLAVLAIILLGPLPVGLVGQVFADQLVSERPGEYPVAAVVSAFSPLGVWESATAPLAGTWRDWQMWAGLGGSLVVCVAMLAAAWLFYRSARDRLNRDDVGLKIV